MRRLGFGLCSALLTLALAHTQGYSLRFYGNGTGDIDRVKIRIDDPTNNLPGPPADIGATDFTIEFWVKGNACGQSVWRCLLRRERRLDLRQYRD
jgi:hypothetical protein